MPSFKHLNSKRINFHKLFFFCTIIDVINVLGILKLQFNSTQVMFIKVPSQQPDGQLQKQHIIHTSIIKDNKLCTYETYT